MIHHSLSVSLCRRLRHDERIRQKLQWKIYTFKSTAAGPAALLLLITAQGALIIEKEIRQRLLSPMARCISETIINDRGPRCSPWPFQKKKKTNTARSQPLVLGAWLRPHVAPRLRALMGASSSASHTPGDVWLFHRWRLPSDRPTQAQRKQKKKPRLLDVVQFFKAGFLWPAEN